MTRRPAGEEAAGRWRQVEQKRRGLIKATQDAPLASARRSPAPAELGAGTRPDSNLGRDAGAGRSRCFCPAPAAGVSALPARRAGSHLAGTRPRLAVGESTARKTRKSARRRGRGAARARTRPAPPRSGPQRPSRPSFSMSLTLRDPEQVGRAARRRRGRAARGTGAPPPALHRLRCGREPGAGRACAGRP